MSTGDELATDVRRFLLERIDAIELLEVLLVLRAGLERAFPIAEISRTLGSNAHSIEARLRALETIRLAASSEFGWRYAPADPAADDLVGRVQQAYRERRLTVINLIYAPRPNDLQLFSDAFRLRDPKKDEPR